MFFKLYIVTRTREQIEYLHVFCNPQLKILFRYCLYKIGIDNMI